MKIFNIVLFNRAHSVQTGISHSVVWYSVGTKGDHVTEEVGVVQSSVLA